MSKVKLRAKMEIHWVWQGHDLGVFIVKADWGSWEASHSSFQSHLKNSEGSRRTSSWLEKLRQDHLEHALGVVLRWLCVVISYPWETWGLEYSCWHFGAIDFVTGCSGVILAEWKAWVLVTLKYRKRQVMVAHTSNLCMLEVETGNAVSDI